MAAMLLLAGVYSTSADEQLQHQKCYDIGFTTLARSGLSYGDNDEYGRLMDFNGNPIVRPVLDNDTFTELLSTEEVGTAISRSRRAVTLITQCFASVSPLIDCHEREHLELDAYHIAILV